MKQYIFRLVNDRTGISVKNWNLQHPVVIKSEYWMVIHLIKQRMFLQVILTKYINLKLIQLIKRRKLSIFNNLLGRFGIAIDKGDTK